jgi:hypothetical protein
MPDDPFEALDAVLHSRGPDAGFELMIRRFREEKKYPLLFEARVMQSRHALGLPLVLEGSLENLPADKRGLHERAYIDAARETGSLFLADGDIPRAWHYFRAIGEAAPVAAAIEQVTPAENQEAIIEIALHERVHPRKGFELILADYGICRAITFLDQYPDPQTRDDCVRLLVRTLHHDLSENLKRAIAKSEGSTPESCRVSELVAGRAWLFGEYDYYVDTSHLISILRFSLDLKDRESLALAVELTEYGKQLSPMFHYRGEPPFEDGYVDYAVYLRALMGECVSEAVAHFRHKAANADPQAVETLVTFLARLGRFGEAIDVSLEHLGDADASRLQCPSVFHLCQMAGDYSRLRDLARQRGDLLHFAAAIMQVRANG